MTEPKFTDEDLKRLKDNGPEWELPYEKLKALLARLEAAENRGAISDRQTALLNKFRCDLGSKEDAIALIDEADEAKKAWRQVSGR